MSKIIISEIKKLIEENPYISYKEIAEKLNCSSNGVYRVCREHGITLMGNTKRQQILRYLDSISEDKKLPIHLREITEHLNKAGVNVTHGLVCQTVKDYGYISGNIPISAKTKSDIEKIKECIAKDPYITYSELGHILGCSRQNIQQIFIKYGLSKNMDGHIRKKTEEKIWKMIRNFNKENSPVIRSRAFKKYSVSAGSFDLFMKKYKDDPELKVFLELTKKGEKIRKESTKTSMIANDIRNTDMNYSDIARKHKTTPGHVSRINKQFGIRPIRKINTEEVRL